MIPKIPPLPLIKPVARRAGGGGRELSIWGGACRPKTDPGVRALCPFYRQPMRGDHQGTVGQGLKVALLALSVPFGDRAS